MRRSPIVWTVLFLAAMALSTAPGAALPREKDKWIRVETENFALIGNASKGRIAAIGRKLERLREVLARTSRGMELRSPLDTKIYVFKNETSFAPYNLDEQGEARNYAGFFVDSPHGNYVAIDASSGEEPFNVIYHEYLHYVLGNNVPDIPLWLNEGLAEFYSSFRVARGKAEIGRPLEGHLWWLARHGLMPLDDLFEISVDSSSYNEGVRQGTFYAQSWALTHMLLAGDPERRKQMGKLLRYINQGASSADAIQAAFHVDLPTLERSLVAYINAGSFGFYRYAPEKHFEDEEVEAQRLERKEVLFLLGELLAHSPPFQLEAAERHLQGALALDDSYAEAWVALAYVRLLQRRPDEASRLCAKAVALAPHDAKTHAIYGWSLVDRFVGEQRGEPAFPETTPPLLLEARERFRTSLEIAPGYTESLIGLGKTFFFENGDLGQGVDALARASRALPTRSDVLLDLIVLTAKSGNRAGARSLLDRALKQRGTADQVRAAQAALVEFDLRQARMLYEQGRPQDARALLQDAVAETDDQELQASLLGVMMTILPVPSGPEVIDLYDQAVEAANAGDLDGAAELFDRVVAADADSDLGVAAREQAREVRRIAAHNRFAARYNEAVREVTEGNRENAIAILEELLEAGHEEPLEEQAKKMLRGLEKPEGDRE